MTRAAVLAALARRDCAIGLDRPIRVAIDGVDASGKTTLANAEAVHDRYARRYVPGHLLYFAEAQPERHASVSVDNDDLERPFIALARDLE